MRMDAFKSCQNTSMVIMVGLFVIGIVLSLNLAALAQEDAKALAKDANQELRTSESLVFKGQLEEAQTHLNTAGELIAKLKSVDPNFSQLKTLEQKYAKLQKELEKRQGKTTPAKPETPQQGEKSAGTGAAEKLPGGVTHRLKQVDTVLQKGDRVLAKDTVASDDWKVKELESVIKEANGLMDEILQSYGDQIPPGHPEVQARQDKIATFQESVKTFKGEVSVQKTQAAEAQARQEGQSQEWLAKISPYITGSGQPGYDEAKYLIAGGTEDVAELVRRKTIYDEAAAVFAGYKQVNFADGKSESLEQAEKDLAYALETFAAQYTSSVERIIMQAREQIAQTDQWLAKEEAKDDSTRQPLMLQKDIIPNIKNLIIAAAVVVSENDPKVVELNTKLGELEQRADKLRQLNKERTFMTPDRFKGQALEELKAKAAEIVQKAYADAALLRTTLISEDWKEERVLEYTDTTKTAVRYRSTRSVTAQVAGKRGNDVLLYTLDISQDKQSDGSWGALYGHVMFTDPMVEANVQK
jgi:hypothetical protein